MLIAVCSFVAAALMNMDVGLAGWCRNAAPARTNTKSSETKITSPSPFHWTPAWMEHNSTSISSFCSRRSHYRRGCLVFSIARLLYLLWVGSNKQQPSAPVSCCKAGSDHPSKATLIILSLDHSPADKFPHPLDCAIQPQRRVMQRSDTLKMRLQLNRTRLVADLWLRSQMTQQQWEYKVTARNDGRYASTTCCDTREGSGTSSPDLSHDLWPQGPSWCWMLVMLMWFSTDEIRDISNKEINIFLILLKVTNSNLNWSFVRDLRNRNFYTNIKPAHLQTFSVHMCSYFTLWHYIQYIYIFILYVWMYILF